MVSVGGKSTFEKWLFSRFTLFAILALCIYAAFSVYERYTVEREMAERRSGLESEYLELQDRRDTLFDKVDYLRGDSGRESEIRKNFDVAAGGEQVVIIVDDTTDEEVQLTGGFDPGVAAAHPWWQFWR